MDRFHIDIHGVPVPCDAKIKCRAKGGPTDDNGDTIHFEGSKEDAQRWAEEENAKAAGGSFGSSAPAEEAKESSLESRVSSMNESKGDLRKSAEASVRDRDEGDSYEEYREDLSRRLRSAQQARGDEYEPELVESLQKEYDRENTESSDSSRFSYGSILMRESGLHLKNAMMWEKTYYADQADARYALEKLRRDPEDDEAVEDARKSVQNAEGSRAEAKRHYAAYINTESKLRASYSDLRVREEAAEQYRLGKIAEEIDSKDSALRKDVEELVKDPASTGEDLQKVLDKRLKEDPELGERLGLEKQISRHGGERYLTPGTPMRDILAKEKRKRGLDDAGTESSWLISQHTLSRTSSGELIETARDPNSTPEDFRNATLRALDKDGDRLYDLSPPHVQEVFDRFNPDDVAWEHELEVYRARVGQP